MKDKNNSSRLVLYFSAYGVKILTILREVGLVFFIGNSQILSIYYISRMVGGFFLGFWSGNLYFVIVRKFKTEKYFPSVMGSGFLLSWYILWGGYFLGGKKFLFYFFPATYKLVFVFLTWELLFAFCESFLFLPKAFFLKDEKYGNIFKTDISLAIFKLISVFFLLKSYQSFFIAQIFFYGLVLVYILFFNLFPFSFSLAFCKKWFSFLKEEGLFFCAYFFSVGVGSYLLSLWAKVPTGVIYFYWAQKLFEWGNIFFKTGGQILLAIFLNWRKEAKNFFIKQSCLISILTVSWLVISGIGYKIWGKSFFLVWIGYLPAIPGRYYYHLLSKIFLAWQKEQVLFRLSLFQELGVFLSLYFFFLPKRYYFLSLIPSLFSFLVVLILFIFFLKELRFQSDKFGETYHK